MPQIIGFLGTYPVDVCLYTAFALQNTGKSVCVNDFTSEGVLFECIPTPEETLEIITFRNVDFMHQLPMAEWKQKPYDYIFVQLGDAPQELTVSSCDELILVIDCEKRHLDEFQNLMQKMRMSMNVVLRGFCPDGIPERKLKEYFEQENCFVERWLTLPFDEMDEAYRIGMQYEPMQSFAHASVGWEKLLLQLLKILVPKNSAANIKAVRAVRSGRVLAAAGGVQ